MAARWPLIPCQVLQTCKANWVRALLGCKLPGCRFVQGHITLRLNSFFLRDGSLSFLVKYQLLSTSVPSDLIGPDCQGTATQPGGTKTRKGDTGQKGGA